MPIDISSPIITFSESEFYGVQKEMMRIVFDVHNEFGRFFDEATYKQAIKMRWQAAGLGTADREVRIRLGFATFQKDLFIDLLFNAGAVLEAKAVEMLTPAHRSQTLTYLFLTGLHHARLVNFRPERVEYEF